MRLTKHITEDFSLENRAKRLGVRRGPALLTFQSTTTKQKEYSTAPLRALLRLLKFRWQ
jgi:hypothetical protein